MKKCCAHIDDKIKQSRLWHWVGLVIVLAVFTALKCPYFTLPFTGEHTMKYNAYVEPAKHMYERNNPFWMQRKYQADPVNRPQGISEEFNTLPIHEWGIMSLLYLFPNNSIELNTRIWTHLFGIVILIFGYWFVRQWFDGVQSLLIIGAMAINPIIGFMSFVTVADSILLICTFVTLGLVSRYIQTRHIAYLLWAGVLWGIGNVSKISIFLWLAPMVGVLLWAYTPSFRRWIRDYLLVSGVACLLIPLYHTSLKHLPADVPGSLPVFTVWLLGMAVLFRAVCRYEYRITACFDAISCRTCTWAIGVAVVAMGSLALLHLMGLIAFSNEFLTDSSLVFNGSLYTHMLLRQFAPMMTWPMFYLGLIGIVVITVKGTKPQRVVLGAFLAGSLVYWITASKSMFFHSYYTGVIMVTFAMAVAMSLYLLTRIPKLIGWIPVLAVVIWIVPVSSRAMIDRLQAQDYFNIRQVGEYLDHQMSADSSFVRPGSIHSGFSILSFYANRASFPAEKLLNLQTTPLGDYNIEYVLLDQSAGFDYLNTVINTNNINEVAPVLKRTQIILQILSESEPQVIVPKTDNPIQIEDQLEYQTTIGMIEIYKVVAP